MFVSNKKNYENTPAFVSSAHIVSRTRTATQAMGTAENGRTILRAGSVFPANDATAEGITLHDVDLTHGDQPVAVMVEGYVYESRLPQAVDALAKPEIPEIKFEEYNATEGE
ncbi:hypothetical protein [Sediminibacillus massiliensis]|uniref:hypothetical protein n=1 Tax=Sediminibacillus massiliensis TaxID=1926277 RepID=UPI00098832A5|nr:hypothetical protein [Sediminibacillus massiliensis]